MMEIKLLAATLLIGRLVALWYLYKVVKIQLNLLKLPTDPDVWDFRKTLHYLTVAFALGNVVPIIIDLVTIIGPERPFWLGVTYAISNTTTALIGAILIHKLYRLAGNTKIVTDLERDYLKTKNKKEK